MSAPDPLNAYAAPRTQVEEGHEKTVAFRRGRQFVVKEGAALPHMCAKCGDPTAQVSKTLRTWRAPGKTIIPGVIAALLSSQITYASRTAQIATPFVALLAVNAPFVLLMGKFVRLDVPLCGHCRRAWTRASILVPLVGMLLPILALPVLVIVFAMLFSRGPITLTLAVVLSFVPVFLLDPHWLSPRVVRIHAVGRTGIAVRGLHPAVEDFLLTKDTAIRQPQSSSTTL